MIGEVLKWIVILILWIGKKAFFQTGETKGFDYRIQALQKLKAGIKKHEEQIKNALKTDLNKSEYEAYTTEIGVVLSEIGFSLKLVKATVALTKWEFKTNGKRKIG